MYFDKFPIIFHSYLNKDGREVLVRLRDVTRNARVRKEILSNITMYEEYAIQDGETPEHVSEKFYDSPDYHWVIMLLNERYDYVSDWPMSSARMKDYVEGKYANQLATHHYEDSNRLVVPSTWPGAISVSNFEYEERINESKRQIKMITSPMLSLLLEDFDKIMAI